MNLLNDNIKKLYFKFLFPSLGSAMVMSVYTLTDAVVIGKGIGLDALAALSFTTPLLCILMSIGILFGIGGSVQMNVFRGLNNPEKANRFFTLSFAALGVICLFLWTGYSLFITQIIQIMGVNERLFPYVADYMKYVNIFLPFVVFSNYFAIFVRADNDPKCSMMGVVIGGVLNIILDFVFVYPLQMGIGGAALASMLGMLLQVTIISSHFFSEKNELHLIKPRHIFKSVWLIITTGIPSFFNELANGVIVFLFNIQILKYCGEIGLSVYSVISNCVILFNSLFTGVGQAIQPIISINHGALNKDRISSVKKMAYVTIVLLGCVFTASGVLYPNTICSFFLSMTPEIEDVAGFGIRVYFLAFLPLGINLLTAYYLQAILQTRKSLCISLLRNIVLSSLGIILFPVLFGAESLWLVMPVVEVCVLVISVFFILIVERSYKNKLS